MDNICLADTNTNYNAFFKMPSLHNQKNIIDAIQENHSGIAYINSIEIYFQLEYSGDEFICRSNSKPMDSKLSKLYGYIKEYDGYFLIDMQYMYQYFISGRVNFGYCPDWTHIIIDCSYFSFSESFKYIVDNISKFII